MELVEKTFKIMPNTYDSIKNNAEKLGLSEGAIIDRFCVKLRPKDKELARYLLSDYLVLTIDLLNDDEIFEVLLSHVISCLYIMSLNEKVNVNKMLDYIKETTLYIREHKEEFEGTEGTEELLKKYNEWLDE